MVSLFAPRPVIVTPLAIVGSALASVIVPVAVKVTTFVSTAVPVVRLLRQYRRVPAVFVSASEVTVQVAPRAATALRPNAARQTTLSHSRLDEGTFACPIMCDLRNCRNWEPQVEYGPARPMT